MNFVKPTIGNPKLCARMYKDKTFAKCIIFTNIRNDYCIISLEDISHNGGLAKYDWYSAGLAYYNYRDLSKKEIYSLIQKKLTPDDIRKIKKVKDQYNIDIQKIIDIKIIRKEKLQHIKDRLSIKDEI